MGIKNKFFLITVLLGSVVLTTYSLGQTQEVRGVSNDTVKIGTIIDQTGLASPVGVPLTEATRTYFRYLNDQGGVNGRKVKIMVEDDRYTIPGSMAAFKKLIFKDEVLSILYCGGTGQILALMRHIEKNRVPVISVSLAEIMTTPVRKYIFTPSASYDDVFKIIIDYIMRDLKGINSKIAFVYPDIEVGKNGLRATEKYLPKYRSRLSSTTIINIGDMDTTSQVLTLRKSRPDYVILHSAVAGLISFYRAVKKYGLRSKIIGAFYVSDEDHIAATGDAMKDTVAISVFGYWSDNTPGMSRLKRITKKYHPTAEKKTRNYTQGWVTSIICAEGLKRAGRDLTPETLVKSYETFRNFSVGEISGPITYSENDHKGGRTYKIYKVDVEKQTWIPITGFREPAIKDE